MLKFLIITIAALVFAYYAHYWIANYYYDVPFFEFI